MLVLGEGTYSIFYLVLKLDDVFLLLRPIVEAEGVSTLRLVPGRDNDYASGNTFKVSI